MADDELGLGWAVGDDGVGWLTLQRPEVRNAISPDQRLRIIALLEEAAARLDVRAVVITGSGDSFCAGADLRSSHAKWPRPDGAPDRVAFEVARGIKTNAQRLITAVMDCEKPVIAAVNGVCAGLGMQLALSCDLVLAAESAKFVEVFARRALVPDGGGAYLLSRILGPHKAKELLLFGDDIPAAAAERLGFVNAVVPDDQLHATTTEWAQRLASGPTRAFSLTKLLVNRTLDMDRTSALELEAAFQDINMTTHDGQEGVNSFIERRPAAYRGW